MGKIWMVKKETIRQEDPLACRKEEKWPSSGNSALADTEGVESRGESLPRRLQAKTEDKAGKPAEERNRPEKAAKTKNRRSHHSFGGFNERGDSFEPHLFYFLDLSQEETCCVLILWKRFFPFLFDLYLVLPIEKRSSLCIVSAECRTPLLDDIQRNERCICRLTIGGMQRKQ